MKKISVVRVIIGKPPHTPQALKSLNESGVLDTTREPGKEVDGVIFYDQFVDNGPQVFAGQSSVEVQIALLIMQLKETCSRWVLIPHMSSLF